MRQVDDDEWESGPFCRHYMESGECDKQCDSCGHDCGHHSDDGDCLAIGCNCIEYIEIDEDDDA